MIVATIDPITGNDAGNLEEAPYIIEGSGDDTLIIYFESDDNKKAYLEITIDSADASALEIYNGISNNDVMVSINQG